MKLHCFFSQIINGYTFTRLDDSFPVCIAQAIRKSLRGQAKRVIVPLGVLASLDDIMDRLENVFGNVASGHSILKEFYTATQTETETSSA